jgi:hypothetical protein
MTLQGFGESLELRSLRRGCWGNDDLAAAKQVGIDGEGAGAEQEDSSGHDGHIKGGKVYSTCAAVECGKPGRPTTDHDQEGNDRNDRSKKASQER